MLFDLPRPRSGSHKGHQPIELVDLSRPRSGSHKGHQPIELADLSRPRSGSKVLFNLSRPRSGSHKGHQLWSCLVSAASQPQGISARRNFGHPFFSIAASEKSPRTLSLSCSKFQKASRSQATHRQRNQPQSVEEQLIIVLTSLGITGQGARNCSSVSHHSLPTIPRTHKRQQTVLPSVSCVIVLPAVSCVLSMVGREQRDLLPHIPLCDTKFGEERLMSNYHLKPVCVRGSWAFWISGRVRRFQAKSGILRQNPPTFCKQNQTISSTPGKIRHFQACSDTFRHTISHDLP